jgi:ketosteroid isomerase-like protein
MRYLLLALAGCGATAKPVPPVQNAPSSELTPAFASVERWLGHCRRADGTTMHWVAASGAMYGVWFEKGAFSIRVVDDGDGGKPADGVLRFYLFDNGRGYGEIKDVSEHERLEFAHVEGCHAVKYEAAPTLEAADRAFAADTKARQIDGWIAAFDPEGGMMRKGKRVEGDAIREMMRDTLANGVLAWDPIASGVEGELGYTVGKATYTPNKAGEPGWASTYITIWRHQPDGRWKVLFDTGRPVNQ